MVDKMKNVCRRQSSNIQPLTLADAKLKRSLQENAETFGKIVDFGGEQGEKDNREEILKEVKDIKFRLQVKR